MNKKRLTDRNDFAGWLIKEKFAMLWGLILAIIPVVLPDFNWEIFRPSTEGNPTVSARLYEFVYYNYYRIFNILLILYIIISLSKSSFLMSADEKRSKKLHAYVKSQFGENSTLAQNTPVNLYNRMRSGVAQFYYSWMAVWGIWLILYVLMLVSSVYKFEIARNEGIVDLSTMPFFRIEAFLENMLNLINSFILLFIYLVITVSTVRVGSLAQNSKVMHACICVFILVFAGCFFTDLFSIMSIVSTDDYQEIQFYLRIVIGLIATISMMAVLGRLNTNFLNIPQWMMLSLYLYASIQMLYPLTYNPIYELPGGMRCQAQSVQVSTAMACPKSARDKVKNISEWRDDSSLCCCHKVKASDCPNSKKVSIEYKRSKTYESLMEKKHEKYPHSESVEALMFVCAFFGKVFLFLALSWIYTRKRFLFFLIHKANTLSDSEMMLSRFERSYDGCAESEE